ncbi:MAG: signal peptidase I [Anaerolineales bacterium]|jgi:signal peptidase
MLLKTILYIVIFGSLIIFSMALLFLGSARTVLTDSMAPALRAGDLVFLRPTGKVINPGTVVTYDFQGSLITHRVVEVVGDILVTKGDNNQEVDPWQVRFSDVVGVPKVRIPYGGYLLDFIKSPAGFLLLIIFPACWIIVIEARRIAANLHDSQAI